ncbi:MAG: histidine kinase dimerization/phospho-acceptor domain-containing protein [Armatimonadia bacterium]
MRMIIDAHGQYFPDQETFAELARQVNHDMRSPLTAICTYAECLAWLTTLDMETREKYAKAIIAEARRLGRMGSYFASLAAPPPDGELEEIVLGEVVDEALEELRDLLELHEVALVREADEAPLPLIWSRPVLRQIMLAAIETQTEWAGPKARLSLSTAVEGESVLLNVVATSERPASFDTTRFGYRSARALLQSHGGKMTLVAEEGLLCLQVPYIGRMRLASSEDLLERSA